MSGSRGVVLPLLLLILIIILMTFIMFWVRFCFCFFVPALMKNALQFVPLCECLEWGCYSFVLHVEIKKSLEAKMRVCVQYGIVNQWGCGVHCTKHCLSPWCLVSTDLPLIKHEANRGWSDMCAYIMSPTWVLLILFSLEWTLYCVHDLFFFRSKMYRCYSNTPDIYILFF